MSGTKETLCSSCGHLPVCLFSKEFLTALKAVDELFVFTEDTRGIRLRDIKWLGVTLSCKHRITNQTIR
jgi:hypothetical protein